MREGGDGVLFGCLKGSYWSFEREVGKGKGRGREGVSKEEGGWCGFWEMHGSGGRGEKSVMLQVEQAEGFGSDARRGIKPICIMPTNGFHGIVT